MAVELAVPDMFMLVGLKQELKKEFHRPVAIADLVKR